MTWRWSALSVVLLASPALAQGPPPAGPGLTPPVFFPTAGMAPPSVDFTTNAPAANQGDRFAGNHNFPNFINFISNPLESIDPRAVTAIYPIFGASSISSTAPLPDADVQLLGPGLTLALSDRFAVGLNQGGYAYAQLNRNQRDLLARLDPAGRFRDLELGGNREGFLNLGGFAQYTLIENVPEQFLLTGGLRYEVPCGSHEVFQGHGPLHLAPYVTAGKEFGEFHILATTGFQFPAGPGNDDTKYFYANLHLDRRCFGWLYPLVEVNSIYHTSSVSFGLPAALGPFDFGNFESEGNVVDVAVGANAVLIPERLEIGAVYQKVVAAQHNFDVDSFLIKMTLRY